MKKYVAFWRKYTVFDIFVHIRPLFWKLLQILIFLFFKSNTFILIKMYSFYFRYKWNKILFIWQVFVLNVWTKSFVDFHVITIKNCLCTTLIWQQGEIDVSVFSFFCLTRWTCQLTKYKDKKVLGLSFYIFFYDHICVNILIWR